MATPRRKNGKQPSAPHPHVAKKHRYRIVDEDGKALMVQVPADTEAEARAAYKRVHNADVPKGAKVDKQS